MENVTLPPISSSVPSSMRTVEFLLMVYYIVVFIVGLFGNLLIVIAVSRYKELKTVVNIFLANLAISDTLFVLLSLFDGMQFILHRWIFGDILCRLQSMAIEVSYTVSVVTLATVAVERYLCICCPYRRKRTVRQSVHVAFGTWLFAISFCTVLLWGYHSNNVDGGTSMCRNDNWSKESRFIFYVIHSVIVYFLPLIILALCHYKISQVLNLQKKRCRDRISNRQAGKNVSTNNISVNYTSNDVSTNNGSTNVNTNNANADDSNRDKVENGIEMADYLSNGLNDAKKARNDVSDDDRSMCIVRDVDNLEGLPKEAAEPKASDSSKNVNEVTNKKIIKQMSMSNVSNIRINTSTDQSDGYSTLASDMTISMRGTMKCQATMVKQYRSLRVLTRRSNVIGLLLTITSIFVVLWTPFIVVRLLMYADVQFNLFIFRASQLLFFTNTAVNFVVYALMSTSFRRAFKGLFRCGGGGRRGEGEGWWWSCSKSCDVGDVLKKSISLSRTLPKEETRLTQ